MGAPQQPGSLKVRLLFSLRRRHLLRLGGDNSSHMILMASGYGNSQEHSQHARRDAANNDAKYDRDGEIYARKVTAHRIMSV